MIVNVLKRDGATVVPFERRKIYNAIMKANNEVEKEHQIDSADIDLIISSINLSFDGTVKVEDIQDAVETGLMEKQKFELAKKYITYRFKRALIRKSNSTDNSILGLIHGNNEEVQRENSNKKAELNSTMRDLIAGEVSKDLTRRFLLPEHIVAAHDRGDIHFHDQDYYAMPEFNCCLPNFRDMLKNGTVINGVKIETPKSFRVACNQVTQIMAAIASNQYGGQTFYLDVLGEYLANTREKYRKKFDKYLSVIHDSEALFMKFGRSIVRGPMEGSVPTSEEAKKVLVKFRKELLDHLVEEEIKEELKAGVQTIQYQINSLLTSNGQSPFVTIFMYLRDDDPYIEENAMIIEEMLKQRIQGLQNREGIWTTPAFPKLIYVLGENNHEEGTPYYYLTKLAAECTAKRMYPDYISEKVMRENYNGSVFGCMGCVDGSSEVWVLDETGTGKTPIEQSMPIERLWLSMSKKFEVKSQNTSDPRNQFIPNIKGIKIWDTMKGYVELEQMNQNYSYDWVRVTFRGKTSKDTIIECTSDHPFDVEGKGTVLAIELENGDQVVTGMEAHCVAEVIDKQELSIPDGKYSYDVTTSSHHFEVNGIYSHNCRSFLSLWVDPKTGEPQWEGRLTLKVKPTLNDVNARKSGVLSNVA